MCPQRGLAATLYFMRKMKWQREIHSLFFVQDTVPFDQFSEEWAHCIFRKGSIAKKKKIRIEKVEQARLYSTRRSIRMYKVGTIGRRQGPQRHEQR